MKLKLYFIFLLKIIFYIFWNLKIYIKNIEIKKINVKNVNFKGKLLRLFLRNYIILIERGKNVVEEKVFKSILIEIKIIFT